MTIAEIEVRMHQMQNELRMISRELLRVKGLPSLPGYGPVGAFENDPAFQQAERLTLELREKDRVKDLAQFDREEKQRKPKAKTRKKLPA